MRRPNVGAISLPGSLLRRPAVWVVCILCGAGVVWAGQGAWAAFESRGTPSCSWPMRIHGKPTGEQADLVRCYLRALSGRNTAELLVVADNDPPVRITHADLAHSADARAGLATATFLPATTDPAYVPLNITYADGATERTGLLNLIAMGGPSSWRMTIGTPANPGSSEPPTAGPRG